METVQKVSFCCSVCCSSCSGASIVAGIFPLISSAMSYISWRLSNVFQVIQCSRFHLTNTNSICKHVIPWLDKQILRLVVHLTSTKNIVISDSLMLPEGPCFGLLCVDNGRSGSQESVVVFQLRLSHTANYWSRRHPLSPHTHTPTHHAPRGWPLLLIFSLAPWRQAGHACVGACSNPSLSLSWNRGCCTVMANALISTVFFTIYLWVL